MPASSRRRLTLTAALCLLGGAVTTVLVAWGLVVWGSRRSSPWSAAALAWPGAAPMGFPEHPDWLYHDEGVGVRFACAGAQNESDHWQGWRLGCGWPLLALDLEHFVHVSRTANFVTVEHWPALSLPKWIPVRNDYPHDGLPTRPVPIGFTLDTLFYASLLAVLFLSPSRLRRTFRLHRGLCPACAYNLAGNTTGVCPECGGRSTKLKTQSEKLKSSNGGQIRFEL